MISKNEIERNEYGPEIRNENFNEHTNSRTYELFRIWAYAVVSLQARRKAAAEKREIFFGGGRYGQFFWIRGTDHTVYIPRKADYIAIAVTIAERIHLFSYRTQKLSSSAPKVLWDHPTGG